MKIIKQISGIVLLASIVLVPVGQAHAAFFDNSSSWSYDTLSTGIQDALTPTSAPTIQSNAVASVTSPADSKTTLKTATKTYTVSASAYSSSVDETDNTPFITAEGTYVRDGIIAANFLPMGTAIKIPALYGNKIFVVEDRMNSRYTYNVDIWFPSKATAMQFGRKTVKIEIVS